GRRGRDPGGRRRGRTPGRRVRRGTGDGGGRGPRPLHVRGVGWPDAVGDVRAPRGADALGEGDDLPGRRARRARRRPGPQPHAARAQPPSGRCRRCPRDAGGARRPRAGCHLLRLGPAGRVRPRPPRPRPGRPHRVARTGGSGARGHRPSRGPDRRVPGSTPDDAHVPGPRTGEAGAVARHRRGQGRRAAQAARRRPLDPCRARRGARGVYPRRRSSRRRILMTEKTERRYPVEPKAPAVLAVDVGGSHVKVLLNGLDERRRFVSGHKLTAGQMVAGVLEQTQDWAYEGVSVGVPAPVRDDVVLADPFNLGQGWAGFEFETAFGKPTKVINDATMQAIGGYEGGRMLFLGLGTGLGSTMILEGVVAPMELGHLPFRKATFEEYVGEAGLERHGRKRWRKA